MARDRRGRTYPRWMHWLKMARTLEPPPPGLPPREKLRRRVVAAYAVLVAVIVALFFPPVHGPIVCQTQSWCRAGLTEVTVAGHTELVGVTGTYPFRPEFQHAMDELKKENEFATKSGPGTYVTVAVAGPLTDNDPRDLHRIEGAIAGLDDANHSGLVGDNPRIRLVLANMDSIESRWKLVADQLKNMVHSDDHLVAVAGMGLSQAETTNAMKELDAVGVPTLGDMITADTISQKTYPPFARTGPDTGQQLDVLGKYLGPLLAGHKAMLVTFSKSTDMYTSALSIDFQKYLDGPLQAGDKTPVPFGKDPVNEFPLVVSNICGTSHIDTVYYAGRAADLPTFLTDLANRSGCAPGPIRVVTTSDTTRLLVPTAVNKQAWQALRNSNQPIELDYTPLADPAFLDSQPESHQQMAALRRLFRKLVFPGGDLNTGWAIMEHDTMLTIAKAVRDASNAGTVPPPRSVSDQLRLIRTPNTAVPGASGGIRLDPATGDRIGLRIPVLRFVPGGDQKILGVYKPDYP